MRVGWAVDADGGALVLVERTRRTWSGWPVARVRRDDAGHSPDNFSLYHPCSNAARNSSGVIKPLPNNVSTIDRIQR
jgi:hypothetical protein